MADEAVSSRSIANFRSPAEGSRMWCRKEQGTGRTGRYAGCRARLGKGVADCVIMEDSSLVPDVYQGTLEIDLKHGLNAPKHNAMPSFRCWVTLTGTSASSPRCRRASIRRTCCRAGGWNSPPMGGHDHRQSERCGGDEGRPCQGTPYLVEAAGNPDDCKVMHLVEAFVGDKHEEAFGKKARQPPPPQARIDQHSG